MTFILFILYIIVIEILWVKVLHCFITNSKTEETFNRKETFIDKYNKICEETDSYKNTILNEINYDKETDMLDVYKKLYENYNYMTPDVFCSCVKYLVENNLVYGRVIDADTDSPKFLLKRKQE